MSRKYMELRDDNKMYRVSVYSSCFIYTLLVSKLPLSLIHIHILSYLYMYIV